MKKIFHTATDEEILEGKVTDVYFLRTLKTLKERRIRKKVLMEIYARKLPHDYEWGILCGVEEVLNLMKGKDVNIYGFEEGSLFYPKVPVMSVEGFYDEFGIYETALLGFLCQSTGIATRAARVKIAADFKIVLSFGARRMHPALAPVIERACYIGGCDGVAAVKSAEILGIKPAGTMPHSLVILFGDTISAIKNFDECVEKDVPRIALIDTFGDEKVEALKVAEFMKDRLWGIRLDTPSSRRGNMKEIIEEVRWELDIRGFKNVKIFVSGGLDEKSVEELKDVADGFGVGTYLSNSPVVDFSMDIIEVEGKPVSKKGKWSGRKRVMVCRKCLNQKVLPFNYEGEVNCSCGAKMEDAHKKLMEGGKIVEEIKKPDIIKEYVLSQLKIIKKSRR